MTTSQLYNTGSQLAFNFGEDGVIQAIHLLDRKTMADMVSKAPWDWGDPMEVKARWIDWQMGQGTMPTEHTNYGNMLISWSNFKRHEMEKRIAATPLPTFIYFPGFSYAQCKKIQKLTHRSPFVGVPLVYLLKSRVGMAQLVVKVSGFNRLWNMFLDGGINPSSMSASRIPCESDHVVYKFGDPVPSEWIRLPLPSPQIAGLLPAGKPRRLTTSDPAWCMSFNAYADMRGAPQPGIFLDCSPAQYAGMSKRARDAYDRRRSEEYDRRSELWQEWKAAILAAHQAREIDQSRIHREAESIIYSVEAERRESAAKAERDRADEWNRIRSLDELRPGQRVYSIHYGAAEVVKLNQKTVRVRMESSGSEVNVKPDWLLRHAFKDAYPAWVSSGRPEPEVAPPTPQPATAATSWLDTHRTWERALQPGDVVLARWTNSFSQKEGRARVVKVNVKSVRVALLAGMNGYSAGRELVMPLKEKMTRGNGVFPVAAEGQENLTAEMYVTPERIVINPEPEAATGLVLEADGDDWIVSGDTYPVRNTLRAIAKATGGRWDGRRQAWRYPEVSDELRALIGDQAQP